MATKAPLMGGTGQAVSSKAELARADVGYRELAERLEKARDEKIRG